MNIAIVGAGLVGRLLAWRLLEAGHSVSLYDKDSGQAEHSAARVAAAMLAPLSEVIDAEPVVYEKGLAGIAVWQDWIPALEKATGIHLDLRTQGSVALAHRNDSGDYRHFLQRLRQDKTINQQAVVELSKAELQAYEPELAVHFDRACFLAEEGCLDNHNLLKALALRITQLGGVWHTQSLHTTLDMQMFSAFDHIIDSRGFGASGDIKGLRGVRGEVIRVHAPEVNISRPVRLMHPRYKLYISPRPNHVYVIGATQIESEDEGHVTVRSSLELLSALYAVHTGFAEARIIEQEARCRPAFSDNLPQITQQEKVLEINGLFRHGYLLAPAVIGQALQMLGLDATLVWPEIALNK